MKNLLMIIVLAGSVLSGCGRKDLVIEALSGEMTFIKYAEKTSYWDNSYGHNFAEIAPWLERSEFADTEGKATGETKLLILGSKNVGFDDVFGRLSRSLKSLCLTQDQIVNFCVKHPEYSKYSDRPTLFLMRGRQCYYAIVLIYCEAKDNFEIQAHYLNTNPPYNGKGYRVIVPE